MKTDVVKQIGAMVREVRSREHQGKPARVIVAYRVYDTTIDDLWNAITTAERIRRWLLPISGDLRLGGRYQLEGNAGGEITKCDPPKHLMATWESRGDVSWIDVKLTPEGKGTRLELEHMAFVPDGLWEQFGPGGVGIGWDLGFLGLARHLADPSHVPAPNEEMALLATAEGKRVVRVSSEAWRDASIASGTPAAQARSAADRTTVAYGGEPAPEDASEPGER